MTRDDETYYWKRVAQEEEAARSATYPQARKLHNELAAAYRRLCGSMATAPIFNPSRPKRQAAPYEDMQAF